MPTRKHLISPLHEAHKQRQGSSSPSLTLKEIEELVGLFFLCESDSLHRAWSPLDALLLGARTGVHRQDREQLEGGSSVHSVASAHIYGAHELEAWVWML